MLKTDLQKLPGLEMDGDEPVFNEPWEAQAFAMTIALHQQGLFSWSEWADALGAEIHDKQPQTYYKHWLSALEKLVSQKNLTSSKALNNRKMEWLKAAENTPHGEAIVLGWGE